MKKLLLYLFVSALLAAALAGCGGGGSGAAPDASREAQGTDENTDNQTATEQTRLRVVSTIFPPYDFVRQIAGERVELTMLLSPGAESHSFEPTPQEIIAISECDLFLYVGGETDLWVDRILASVDTEAMTVLALMEMVEVLEEEIVEGMEHDHSHDHEGEDHDEEHEDHEHEPELDEHVWTSPRNAAVIVQGISQTLCALDPANADAYRQNTDAYVEALEELDSQFQAMVDSAARRTVVFGDRFPFRYLADAYGLTYFAAFPGCSTETEPSPTTVAFLLDKVREEQLPVVFHIELSNERMADAVCEGTGAKKLLLHSCHNVTRDDFAAGVTYLELMRSNLENLKEALN